MADIKLVIKIPEEEYKNICLMSKDGIGMALYDWIANGKLLPKGHGRLIDADALDFEKCTLETDSSISYYIVDKDDVNNAPTVIEADREV